MASINDTGKVAYMYDEQTDTWYSLAGVANPAAAYTWTGTNTFSNTVIFEDVVRSEAGINNFQSPSARDTALPSPVNGIVCFVRQDNQGAQINQLQYYFNGVWRNAFSNIGLSTQTANYTLVQGDAGRSVVMNMSVANTVTIPNFTDVPFSVGETINVIQQGAGQTEIVAASGVVLNSKEGNKKLNAQYSAAAAVNVAQNSWILIGDLTA